MDDRLNGVQLKIGEGVFDETLGKNSGTNPPSEVGVLDVTPIRCTDESASSGLGSLKQCSSLNGFR